MGMGRGDLIQIAAPDNLSNAAKQEIDMSVRNDFASAMRRSRSVVAGVSGKTNCTRRVSYT
jgi:hypothetical protein